MSMNESAVGDLSGGAAPVAADLTGMDSVFDYVDTLSIDSPAATETPLPTDAALEAGAVAETPKPAEQGQEGGAAPEAIPAPDQAALDAATAAKPAAAAVVAAAEPAKDDAPASVADPELSAEENRLVTALPEADRAEGARRMKAGSFYSHFKDSTTPITGTIDELFKQSASRAGEMQTEFVARAIKDPVAFAKDYFARDPEGYGQFVSTIFKGDSRFFAKEFTGRDDVTPEQVREAIEFHERNKDKITDDQATELSAEELSEIEETLPEVSAKVKAILAQPTKTAEELKQVKAELEKFKGGKEQEQTVAAQEEQTRLAAERTRIAGEQSSLRDESLGHIESVVTRDLIDAPVAKGGLGLAITDQEKQSAPDVAHLKSVIRGLLLKGGPDDLPGFERGMGEWGKTQEEFVNAGKQWANFVNVREKQNVMEVADSKLLPFAKTYFAERAAHPAVKSLLAHLQTLTQKVSQPPAAGEKFIGGAAPGTVKKPEPTDFGDYIDSLVDG